MQSLDAIRQQFETELAHSGLSDADKNAARVRLAERLDQEHKDRVDAIVQSESSAQSSSPLRAMAGTAVAGATQFANAATLGYLPKIVGALGGSSENTSNALEAMKRTNPIASAAGTIGGYLDPATPAAKLATGASGLASGAIRGIGGKAFAEIASRPFWQRASARFIENLAGGTAAVGATEAVGADGGSLSQRLADTVNSAPMTAGISAAAALASARWMRPVSNELQPLFEKFKRITGKEISPDIATNSAELQATFANMQRIPGMADEVANARGRLVGGLREMVRDMGAAAGAKTNEAQAAGAVRTLVGSRNMPSPITAARRAPEEAALAQAAGGVMSADAHKTFLSDVSKALADRDPADPRGGAMSKVLGDLAKYGSQPFGLDRLEAFRKRLGDIAFTMSPQDPRFATRGRVEASRLYAIVDKAIGSSYPDYGRALKAGEKLRRMEESLADVKVSDVDAKTVARFWGGDDPIKRFDALKRFATPEDVGAVKGFLFDGLVRYATLADGSLSIVKLKRALDGGTMFNRKVVDAALPGVADELLKVGKVYDIARQGVLRGEGSPTAGAMLRVGNMALNSAGAAGLVASLFTNPYLVIGPILGGAGMRWVIRKNLASMMNGARADAISQLGQGQLPAAIGRSAVAAQQVGGIPGAIQLGAQGAGSLGSLAGLAARGAANMIRRPANEGTGQ